MLQERLIYLLERYYHKTASPQEREELFVLMEDNKYEEQIRQFIETTYAFPASESMSEASSEATLRVVLEVADRQPVGGKQPTRTLFMRKWWVAAAVLCLLTGTTYWMLHTATNPVSPVAKNRQIDMPPGSDKAVLTLEDGSTLVLDSAVSGTIKQGMALVQQTQKGLVYQVQGKGDVASYNTLSTPRGGQFHVQLADGTQVWLNAASSLRYPSVFFGSERIVEVTGEAYFEVAENAGKPFKVKVANTATVEVLGTHFNINAYSDEANIKTTLLEGAVRVHAGSKATLLAPGQQVQVDYRDTSVRLIPSADVVQAVAWKNGAFSFTNADLPAVMRQLSRWYNVDVAYEGQVPAGTFNGEIGRGLTLSQVLEGLAESRVKYRIVDKNKIIIQP
jgi:ferric-dicitrate binding protein FerR (iron transport regulator)